MWRMERRVRGRIEGGRFKAVEEVVGQEVVGFDAVEEEHYCSAVWNGGLVLLVHGDFGPACLFILYRKDRSGMLCASEHSTSLLLPRKTPANPPLSPTSSFFNFPSIPIE